MWRSIKNYVKARPKLYDFVNALRPLEDDMQRWLDGFSRSMGRRVNFVQIGTSDGLRWDPVRRFVIRDDWNGVLVEPLPPVFDLLRANYAHVTKRKLVFVNAAVSAQDAEALEFWSFSEAFCQARSVEERLYYLRRSSTNRAFVEATVRDLDVGDDAIKCYPVPCLSVNTLIDKYWEGDAIDLLFIDAEGHDDQVIRGVDFEAIQPQAIVYESHNLQERKQPLQEFLEAKGYVVTDVAGDSVAERTPPEVVVRG